VAGFALYTLVVTLLTAAAGAALAGPAGRTGAVVGAVVAGCFQAAVFAGLLAAFPGQALLAHGVGMAGRVALLAVCGFVMLPLTGLPAAPTLLALVTVLFATMVAEPVFFAERQRRSDDR
jgi:hypothetical protein